MILTHGYKTVCLWVQNQCLKKQDGIVWVRSAAGIGEKTNWDGAYKERNDSL